MCVRLVRDNVIVRTWRKSGTFIPKGFDPHAGYYFTWMCEDIKPKTVECLGANPGLSR